MDVHKDQPVPLRGAGSLAGSDHGVDPGPGLSSEFLRDRHQGSGETRFCFSMMLGAFAKWSTRLSVSMPWPLS